MQQVEAGRGGGEAAGDWYKVPLKTDERVPPHILDVQGQEGEPCDPG